MALQVDRSIAVAALAELHPADIPQAQCSSLREGPDDEILQVVGAAQPPLSINGQADQLPLWCW